MRIAAGWEIGRSSFPVHTVSSILRVVCVNDGQQAIALKEPASRLVGENVRAAVAHVIIRKALSPLFFSKIRMSSKVLSLGEIPPWTQKNCLFIIAARGGAQNESKHASYRRFEYLCSHSSLKVNDSLKSRHS